jgi:peptide/nickel transport system substrate-binding protein
MPRPLILAALAALAWHSASCMPREEYVSSRGASLVVASVGDALTLDPAAISDNESAQVAMQIFDGLVRNKEGTSEVEPALATRWTVSKDGTVWTFRLRRGVRFHDGTPFDASAVVFSFERQRNREHPFHFHAFTYWESTFRNIRAVTALDPYAVRIRIDRPYAPFLANLAMFPVSIVSPTAMRKHGKGFASSPVGTGPFRLVHWEKGERITLTANSGYWDGPPRVQHLVYEVVPDAGQRLVSLQSGTVDVAYGLAPEDRQLVRLHPDLTLYRVSGNNVAFLAMNTQRPPFDDARVRRAVNHAVNKNAIVKLVYQGLAIPAKGPIPPALWSYNPRTAGYAHDPGRARSLLSEAGYDRSRTPRLYVMSTPRPYLPAPVLVAKMIARNLAEVGIKIEIVVRPFADHLRATQLGEHDLCLAGWAGDNGDPDNFLYLLLDRDNARRGAARNQAMFMNESLHILLVAAQAVMDPRARERYYRRAQEIVAEEAPWVPLAHTDLVVAARRSVRNLQVHQSTIITFRKMVKH